MKCPQCGEPIKWQEQHEYEDFNLEGDGIINVHLCTNIDCNVEEVYIFQKDEQWAVQIEVTKDTKQTIT